MKKRISSFRNITIIMLLVPVLIGCTPATVQVPTPTSTPQPPQVNLVLNPNISDVSVGQTVALSIEASGQDIKYKWSAARGTLSASDTPSTIYTPPNTSGVDTVTV